MPVEDRPEDQYNWFVLNSLGPWVGLGANLWKGADALFSGDWDQAIKGLAPKLVSDALLGGLNWGEPTKTRDEIAYYSPSTYDRLLNIIGLKSADQATAQFDRNAVYSGTQRARDRKAALLADYHLATDSGEMNDAMQAIMAFNRTNPDIPIARSAIKSSATSRMRKIQNATELGVPLSADDTNLARRLMRGE